MSHRTSVSWRCTIPVMVACLAIAGAASAQQRPATLSGRVTDRSTGNGLAKAELILMSDSRSVATDSLGNYIIRDLPQGFSQLLVRAPEFRAITIIVELEPGQQLTRSVILDSTAAARRSYPATSRVPCSRAVIS